MSVTPYIFLNLAAAVMALALSAYAWRRRRTPGGRSLSALMAAVAIWAAGAAVELGSTGVEAKLRWVQIQYVGTVSVPVLFFLFALEFNRLSQWIRPRTIMLLALVPAATLILAASNSRHGLMWSSLTPDPSGSELVIYGHGLWFWIGGVGYSYLLAVASTLLLIRAAAHYQRVYHRQAAAVLAGAVFPWVASLLYNLGWIPIPGLDPTPMAFAASGLITAFAVFRLGFLDLAPVARGLLVEALEDGMLVLDLRQRVIDLNPAACGLLGIEGGAPSIGTPLTDLFSHRPEVIHALLSSREPHFEIATATGWVEVRVSRLDEGQAHAYGRLVILRDITGRKRAEEARLAMERKLLQSQKMESIGLLAGGIAHDFNNLLMVIQGGIELTLLDLPADSPVRKFLDQATLAAERAADLTRQVLDYSGRGRTVLSELDLSAVVNARMPLLRASIAKTIELDLRLDADLPHIFADAAQVQQMVVNLVLNAAEAIEGRVGSIRIATGVCECDAVQLAESRTPTLPEPGRFVHLSVADNGCGMVPEVSERIFEPFFSTKVTGRGLGLSAVQGIVQGCRGALLLESRENRGTLVRVLFPVGASRRVAMPELRAVETAPPALTPAIRRRTGGRLLVVDDEDMVREVCQSMLERLGVEVVTAADGNQAVELYREEAADIDGVILDYAMPQMDGLATLRQLAAIRPDVKAVLSSGYSDQDATRRFTQAGFDGFIQKPYQFEQLRAAVRGAFGLGAVVEPKHTPKAEASG